KSQDNRFWSWGSDNLFPVALAQMARRSATHRRILNDKADYISGKGFVFDDQNSKLAELVKMPNCSGETLRQLLNKVAFDKCLFGNAFVEVVTDDQHSFVALFHHDASKCRLCKDNRHVLLHHNWAALNWNDVKRVALFPNFEKAADGTLRAMIHYKDYEPMFENYGVPPYIAGMNVSAIAYKTDRWNISRLDNSFQPSGVMVLAADLDNEEQAQELIKTAEQKFAGKPGQVMFMVKNDTSNDHSQFIPMNSNNDADWLKLHQQATGDIVVAHSWFRTLSGLDYSNGFSAERILQEYEVALNTIILAEQEELLEPIRKIVRDILECDDSSLEVVNRPPTNARPDYIKVWEARRADGLDFDPEAEDQNLFLAQLKHKTQ
ncbi:MAG: phage portal protein, partial [Rikenellaceae bacterium]|nr:phage portal protein [Rikenellaceae bacterium]